ncbi:hypothetical protein FA15DRAFT_755935 [Coprinopsis marcescibilis]|uniref:Nephrocystin 3-like N-terminal domain-containing protein n=1 Tax=Coprinopsis marcescibilis TaxID=230819 RepID=A0A5C3KZM1_COPMA|nr:hypothetical protein FA15DRAFT_755935 [Coprinopsis marcescibilis]
MPFFQQSQNFTIGNGVFNDFSTFTTTPNGLGPLMYLQESAASGAAHDSDERWPPPKCHVETRKRVLALLIGWIQQRRAERAKSIMWLYGPAGMGKSAIAQTIAEQCEELDILAAAFFFNRLDPQRNRAARLVASLALQICETIPGVRPHVEEAIRSTPTILKKALHIQLKKLIIEPMRKIPPPDEDHLVILDGLDECLGPENSDPATEQMVVLRLMETIQAANLPLIILIVSRPESWIQDGFQNLAALRTCTEHYDLYKSSDRDEDVETYLRSEFARIRLESKVNVPEPWPSDKDIYQLVQRASGQFIYAATVIRYIGDPWSSSLGRLETVLSSSPPEDHNPLEMLDNLYMTILQQSPNHSLTKEVLGCLVLSSRAIDVFSIDVTGACQAICKWPPYALRGLHSLVRTAGEGPPFYHATLSEFMESATRSGSFYTPDPYSTYGPLLLRNCLLELAHDSTQSNGELALASNSGRLAAKVWPGLWRHGRQFEGQQGTLDALLQCIFPAHDPTDVTNSTLDMFLLGPLMAPAGQIELNVGLHKLKKCILHIQASYDKWVLDALNSLPNRQFFGRFVESVLQFWSSADSFKVNFAFPTIYFEGTSISAAFDNILDKHRSMMFVHPRNGPNDHWEATMALCILMSLHPDIIQFLATPSRSQNAGWNLISDGQITGLAQACLRDLPSLSPFKDSSMDLRANIVWAVSAMLPLVKSPEVILPELEDFHEHCKQWELEHDPTEEGLPPDNYFNPFDWCQQAVIRSIFCGNTEMALALLDFLERRRPRILASPARSLYDALRRDPKALMTLIDTGELH